MSAVGDIQLAVDFDAALRQCVQLGKERLRVQRHAVPDDADSALEDAGGDLVEHELAGPGVDGVAGVRASLIAHDEVGALGEHVDDLAFAFIPPLGADDDDAVVLGSEHRPPSNKKAPGGGSCILWGKLRDSRTRVNAARGPRPRTLPPPP